MSHRAVGPVREDLVGYGVVAVLLFGLVLAAYLSAHRTMINGSALCAALAVTERE
jgi:hypothetical protein